jgi:hypothetical protein
VKKIKTPMLNKLGRIKDKAQVIGEFMEWLRGEKRIVLCESHEESSNCYRPHKHGKDLCFGFAPGGCTKTRERDCPFKESECIPISFDTNKFLAEFFEIDLNQVEKERLAILKSLRSGEGV